MSKSDFFKTVSEKTVSEVGNDVETEFTAYDHATGNPPTPPDTSKLANKV